MSKDKKEMKNTFPLLPPTHQTLWQIAKMEKKLLSNGEKTQSPVSNWMKTTNKRSLLANVS